MFTALGAIQVAVELLWNMPGWGVTDESMSHILNSPLTGKYAPDRGRDCNRDYVSYDLGPKEFMKSDRRKAC
jgi:hypothetical protein